MCGFTICQHLVNVHDVSGGDDECDVHTWEHWKDSFASAIEAADGRVLAIIDPEGMFFTRSWVMLETYFAREYNAYTACDGASGFDMSAFSDVANAVGQEGYRGAAWIKETYHRMPRREGLRAVGITDGPAAVDSTRLVSGHPIAQTYRQSFFPIEHLRAGLSACLSSSSASVAADRVAILNYVAGRLAT